MRYLFISYALPMRFFYVLLLTTFALTLNAETVYKSVDENGNIIFTDKPSENSEEIKLQKLQTIENPNPAKFNSSRPPANEDAGPRYKTFLIANPADGSGLRSNNGNVSISISLEPSLNRGHTIVITLDGKEVSNGSASSVSLQNINRGTHSIGANVLDRSGKMLASTSSSFSLLRASQ